MFTNIAKWNVRSQHHPRPHCVRHTAQVNTTDGTLVCLQFPVKGIAACSPLPRNSDTAPRQRPEHTKVTLFCGQSLEVGISGLRQCFCVSVATCFSSHIPRPQCGSEDASIPANIPATNRKGQAMMGWVRNKSPFLLGVMLATWVPKQTQCCLRGSIRLHTWEKKKVQMSPIQRS